MMFHIVAGKPSLWVPRCTLRQSGDTEPKFDRLLTKLSVGFRLFYWDVNHDGGEIWI